MIVKYALLVGINKYSMPGNDLSCAVNDCLEMERLLGRSEYSFTTIKLLDEDATRDAIREYFRIIAEEEDLSDFLFYFSGHGVTTSSETFLCTHDMKRFEEGIGINMLARMLNDFIDRKVTVTVILDACHSGDFGIYQSSGYAHIMPDRVDSAFSLLPADYSVFAACGRAEVCNQNFEKGLSEFSIEVLNGLAGEAADETGYVTVSMLFRYLNTTYNVAGWPRAIYKTNLSDDYYLGAGFPPKLMKINSDPTLISEAVLQGQDLLGQYLKIGETSVEEWKQIQFSQSAKKLSSILGWMKSQESKHVELGSDKGYLSLKNSVVTRLKRLGNIESGSILGDFVFLNPIGAGSFGTVWKIQNRLNGEFRAFKVYHSNELDMIDKSSRFLRGYKAMQKINHPQVVKVKEWYDAPFAFDMEFIDGSNLREMAGAITDSEDMLTFLLGIASILAFTHKEGVLHRDIKPENVLAVWREKEKQYYPIITDFDLAWFDTATKMTKDALGSLGYAAPEQLSSTDARITRQPTVDVYSFGQLVYFMIQGSDPRQNAGTYNAQNLKKRLQAWTSPIVAESLMILYETCTKDSPRERYQNFEEVTAFIQNIISEQYALRSGQISTANYIDFVLHGYGGICRDRSDCSFLSATGRSMVEIGIEGSALKITLSANGPLILESLSNAGARKVLFERFSRKFSPFRNVEIVHGNTGTFQIHVIIHLKEFDLHSLNEVRAHIGRAIGEMER
jgi:serine/threonine protein kinase